MLAPSVELGRPSARHVVRRLRHVASVARACIRSAPLHVHKVSYGRKRVGDVEVFYREAGRPAAPVILRLHGFPTSRHLFRNLIPALGDRYRVIAQDMPGFGNTVAPPRAGFEYSFGNLAKVIGLRRRDLASPAMLSTSLTMARR
jgi:hypothetical protein